MSADKLKLEVLMGLVEKVTGPLKNITKGSGQTAKALKAAKDELKQLNDAQNRADGWRKTSKDVAIVGNQLKAARQHLKTVKAAMAETTIPTREMQRALKDAQQQVSTYGMRLSGLIDKKKRLHTELAANGVDLKNLKRYQSDLAGQIDKATAAVNRETVAMDKQNAITSRMIAAQKDYNKLMGASSRWMGRGRTALAVGATGLAPIGLATKAYADLEDSATQLNVAMMTAGGKVIPEFKAINDLAIKLGNKLPGTTADYQDMMTMLIRQGMSAKSILGGLGQATAYLGVQLKMPMTEAAEFASKLQDATRTSEKDMMGLMDVIQKTFYLGVDSNNMLDAFAKLSPALSTLRTQGLEATKAIAPLLVMADQSGMRGEAAGNAYRKVFQNVMDIKRMGKANAISGLGLDFTNGKGEFGGMDKMFAQMQKLKGLTTQKRLSVMKAIFGDDAETLQAVSLIIDKGKGGYEEVQKKMAAQAALQERVNKQLGTLKNLWDAASGTFTNALATLGESIAPELKALTEWIGNVSERVQTWASANPAMAGAIMKTIAVVALLIAGFGALSLALGALIAPFAITKFLFSNMGIKIAMLGGKLMSLVNPWTKVMAAFAAGYAIGTLINVWLDNFVSKIFGYKTTLGGAIFDIVQMFKKGDWSQIGMLMLRGIEAGLDFLTMGLYSKMKNIAGGLITTAKKVFGIKSPSTVFNVLGRYTMAGLSGGIEAGRQGAVSAVSNAARKVVAAGAGMMIGGAAMAGPAIDTRPALAGQGSGSGGIYIGNITIQAAPGQSAQDIATAVRLELENIERQRSARGRSRLSDKE